MATVYVTFSLREPGSRWRWDKFSDGWVWAGTTDMMRANSRVEEWFTGPSESVGKMKRQLNIFFTNLEVEGVVRKFRVSSTRSIPDDGKKGLPRGLPR